MYIEWLQRIYGLACKLASLYWVFNRQIVSAPLENFQDMQPLRFALASVLRSLSPEIMKSNTERFNPRTNKCLFKLLLLWSDDTNNAWDQETASDYQRKIECYKSTLNMHTKGSMEHISIEKDINDQVQSIHGFP